MAVAKRASAKLETPPDEVDSSIITKAPGNQQSVSAINMTAINSKTSGNSTGNNISNGGSKIIHREGKDNPHPKALSKVSPRSNAATSQQAISATSNLVTPDNNSTNNKNNNNSGNINISINNSESSSNISISININTGTENKDNPELNATGQYPHS